jgi:hypothetical protein
MELILKESITVNNDITSLDKGNLILYQSFTFGVVGQKLL